MSLASPNQGSIWRRWDLHIHCPGTKLADGYTSDGDVWAEYIDALEASPVAVFGITDYFSADGYFTLVEKYLERYPKTNKVFFPNIELRLAEAISRENSNPHIHVIFDNDTDQCGQNDISNFLATLKTLVDKNTGARISCAELRTTAQYEAATVTIEELRVALKGVFGDSEPYLIAFPGKNDGVRSTDVRSPRKVGLSDKLDKLSDLFFGDSGCTEWFLGSARYKTGESDPKPVVSGSDAHSFPDLERLDGNVKDFEPTWIKADQTFRGLKQICFEPGARVHIGTDPAVLERQMNQGTKFLSNLKVSSIDGYDGSNGEWFQNVSIDLNPELVVIIGNKGSGKSALVDIVGLLSDSRQEDYFSFLTNKGSNKKFRQRGYSENFKAELQWQKGDRTSRRLDERVDRTKPERVRYLPQSYFEQLTNEIEIADFRREIEDVVFSHVDETDRMKKDSFAELQEFKTLESKQETSALKSNLRALNIEIVELEKQGDPAFRQNLEGDLNSKKNELESLKSSEPEKEQKPDQESSEQRSLAQKIESLTARKDALSLKEETVVDIVANKKSRLQTLQSLLNSISLLESHITSRIEELKKVCDELGLNIEEIVNRKINLDPINRQIGSVQEEIASLEKDNNREFTEDSKFDDLTSLPDIRAALKYLKEKNSDYKRKLGTPQRKYQKYLDKLAAWKGQVKEVVGDAKEPRPGTINYLEEKIRYIDRELSPSLMQVKKERTDIARKIFASKGKILTFYSELKESVERKLSVVRTPEFSVEIEASFVLNRTFPDDFLKLINKTKRGSFHSTNDAYKVLRTVMADTEWNDFESVSDFINGVLELLSNYGGEPVLISDQISDVKEFYDFLFSLEYLTAKYELRLGGKGLNELSPGEKGLLLLIFYLQLDKDNIPLVIDQPEDNLDNDSIFKVLAQCIRQAKKNRQVVLVTHNPNLAVGADAEQVIYVKLEKARNYKFSFESGSIENPKINQRIIDVLEGSQPAFVKRRLMYQIR